MSLVKLMIKETHPVSGECHSGVDVELADWPAVFPWDRTAHHVAQRKKQKTKIVTRLKSLVASRVVAGLARTAHPRGKL